MPARSAEYMDDMRERILVATLDRLENKGLANMSLNDVCEQAQISKGALYVHFKSKGELLRGVVDRAARRVQTGCHFTDGASLRAMLLDVLDRSSPDDANVMYAEMELLAAARTDEALRDAIRRNNQARAAMFRAGVRSLGEHGQLREDVPEQAAVLAVTCLWEGMVMLTYDSAADHDAARQGITALLSGLLTPKAMKALPEAGESARRVTIRRRATPR